MENQRSADEPLVSAVIDQEVNSDDAVSRKVTQLVETEMFRRRTTAIIVDHTNSVPFMRKVQEYADEQIDKKIFKNVKVTIGVIVGWIVTAVIAFVAAKLS